MQDKKYEIVVTLPGPDGFIKKYPRFSAFLGGEGKLLFDLIVQPSVFVKASVLADFGYPSVLAVAKQCKDLIAKSEKLSADSFTKQFIGSVVCTLMEANGYRKTGTKKSVPHEMFTTGEYYQPDPAISRMKSMELCGTTRLTNLTAVDTSINIS